MRAKLHGRRCGARLPYRVAATLNFGRQIGDDVKSDSVRVAGRMGRGMWWCQRMVISPPDGDLEAILEGGHWTGKRRKGCVEMTQAGRIRKSVGFDRRIAHEVEPCPEEVRGTVPVGKPAISTGKGEHGQACLPRPMTCGCRCTGSDEGDKLGGSQRCVGQDVVPVDRKRPAAAYV